MKTYTITETLINYTPAEHNGVKYNKVAGREKISTMQTFTAQAMKKIEMYARNIRPFTLNFDGKGRVESCILYFELNESQTKEIKIQRNSKN